MDYECAHASSISWEKQKFCRSENIQMVFHQCAHDDGTRVAIFPQNPHHRSHIEMVFHRNEFFGGVADLNLSDSFYRIRDTEMLTRLYEQDRDTAESSASQTNDRIFHRRAVLTRYEKTNASLTLMCR